MLPKNVFFSFHNVRRWIYIVSVLTGTVVGKVEAVFETLTPITYSVQEDDGENLFLLSPLSGDFLLSRSLDFEAQSLYVLTVVVQQGDSQVSSVRVYFNVLDVNDNRPIFTRDTFSASLLEDARACTCFLSLNVSDEDDGKCWSNAGVKHSSYFTFLWLLWQLRVELNLTTCLLP